MKKFLTFLAKKLWPDFETLAEPDRVSLLGQLFGTLYSLPLAIVSVGWLVVVTDLDLVRSQWPVLLLFLGLGFIFSRLTFFQVIGKRAGGYSYDDNVSKISVVGMGMATQPGVAQRMFRALGQRDINILMITTSEIKISALVGREHAQEALRT